MVYRLDETASPSMSLDLEYGMSEQLKKLALPESISAELFLRSGRVQQITVTVGHANLYGD